MLTGLPFTYVYVFAVNGSVVTDRSVGGAATRYVSGVVNAASDGSYVRVPSW